MFNPRPIIQLIPIAGHHPCVVIDDFLLDPQALVEIAVRFRGSFTMAPHNAYPGLELPTSESYSRRLNDFFMQHVRHLLGARLTLDLFSRLSMVTLRADELSPHQRICHRDRLSTDPQVCFGASVLYLFHDARLGGTSFFVPKIPISEIDHLLSEWKNISNADFSKLVGTEPAYMTTSNDYFELVRTVPAAWNRVIFYDGSIFHSGHITAPEKMCADPSRGRLTINSFFTCRRSTVA